MHVNQDFPQDIRRANSADPRTAPRFALTRLGALLVVGYISVSLIAAGAVALLRGADFGYALALMMAGGTAATLAWRSAGRIIDTIDGPDANRAATRAIGPIHSRFGRRFWLS